MNREELQQKVAELGPWHYCHQFPHGVRTGDSPPDLKQDKIIALEPHLRPVYPKVLDLGANSGLISMWFVDNKGSEVKAIEYGPKYYPQLELAVKMKNYSSTIDPVYADIHKGNFGSEEYDLVLLLGVLHHLRSEEYQFILTECKKALYPGGEIIAQTRSELPVADYLTSAGFLHVQKIVEQAHYGRSAWKAIKDPMKVGRDV